jgi:hypothetical protein
MRRSKRGESASGGELKTDLLYGNAAFDEKPADLVDDGGALPNKAGAYATRRELCSRVLIATKFIVGQHGFAVMARRLDERTEVLSTEIDILSENDAPAST